MPCINAVSFHEDVSIESICQRVLASGFDALEVSRPPFFEKLTTETTRRRFSAWAADQGLRLYGFDCWVDVLPYTQLQQTLEDFQAAIQFAKTLDLGMLITHDPWAKDNDGRDPDECLEVNLNLFRQVADWCGDAGLKLVFEPHPDTLSMDNQWCLDFIDGLGRPHVGVLYDCCHYGVGQPDSYVESIAKLGDRIKHIHFSDGDRQTYALHLVLGEGDLDLTKITEAFQSIRYQDSFTCDMYNYPMLDDGARRNVGPIRDVEQALQLRVER